MIENPHLSAEQHQRWQQGYEGVRRNLWLRRRRIRGLVTPPAEGFLLELGAGDGLNVPILRDIGCERVIGLEYGVDLTIKSGLAGMLAGDGQAMPFADASLAAIFIDNVLHHMPDYDAAASEIHRVLAGGGDLYCIEPRPGVGRSILDGVTFSPLSRVVPYLRSRRVTIAEEWELYSYWLKNHQRMEGLLLEAGLELVSRSNGPLGMFLHYRKPN